MPSTNFSKYARIPEVTKGVTPATPGFEWATMTGEGMKAANTFQRSEVITGERGIVEHLKVGDAVTGNFTTEMGGGWHDWLFELAFFDRFVGAVEAFNLAADQNVTDLTGQTLTAAGAWVAGMLIDVDGMALAGNSKKRFKAQAGTGAGTIVAPAGTFTGGDEVAPPVRARALAVGFEGATGDLVTAADGVTSTALDFTTMPIPVDASVKILGLPIGTVYAPVAALAANKITLRKLPSTWAAGVGAGLALQILVGEPIEPGNIALTETHEKQNTRMSPIAYERFVGVACGQLVIPLEIDQIIRPSAQLVGFVGAISETPIAGATYSDPFAGVTNRPMKTGNNVARLVEGSSNLAVANCVTRGQITINNNLTPARCLAHDAAVDWNEGDFEWIFEGAFRFSDKTIMEKYYNGTLSGFYTVVFRDGWAYAIEGHAGVYTDAGALSGARNQELTLNVRLEGIKDLVTGKLMTISRFRSFNA